MSGSPNKYMDRRKNRSFLVVAIMCSILFAVLLAEIILRFRDVADPPAFVSDSRYGYIMRPNQSVSTHGYRFRINRFGLRGADFAMPKPSGYYRIVFLGDSVTYGGGTNPDPSLFVNRVASSLSGFLQRPVEAVNVSAPNWGIGNMVSYLQTNGLFDADLVVWVIPSADFRRPTTSLSNDAGLPENKSALRLAFVLKVVWLHLQWTVGSLRQRFHPGQDRVADSSLGTLTQNLATLRRGIDWIRSKGPSVVVVLIPAATGYEHPGDLVAFHGAAESSSVPTLDLGSNLVGRPEDFIDGVHLNIMGNKVVAEAIANFLEQTYFRNESVSSLGVLR